MPQTSDIEQPSRKGEHNNIASSNGRKSSTHHNAASDNFGRCRRLGLIGAVVFPLAIVILLAILLSLNGGKDNDQSSTSDAVVTTSDTPPPSSTGNNLTSDNDNITFGNSTETPTSASTFIAENELLQKELLDLQEEYFGKRFVIGKRCSAGSIVGVSRKLPLDDNSNQTRTTSRIIVPFGQTTTDDPNNPAVPITSNTLFEIGSISKPLTALVLADMIVSGQFGGTGLDTPLNELLPMEIPDLKLRDQTELVTLRQLVTHTAGLPRLSSSMIANSTNWNLSGENPYAGYTEQNMISDLIVAATENVAQTLPNTFQYSNFGFSVLAYILSRMTGTPFSALQKSVTDRLGMNNTWIVSSATALPEHVQQSNWLSSGYNQEIQMPYWFDGGLYIDGAGSTLSSAKDLLVWMEALIGFPIDATGFESNDALHLSLTPLVGSEVFEDEPPNAGIAYAWFYANHEQNTSLRQSNIVYAHTGGTAGYATHVSFQPSSNTAIVAMTNCAHMADDLVDMANALETKMFYNVSDLIL